MSEEINTKKLLRGLARQLTGDRNSMAHLLANYRQQRGLTEAQLAEELDTTPEMLVLLSICRSPDADSAELDSQIASLAAYCEVDRAALTRVIEFVLRTGYRVTAPSQPALQPSSMVATDIAHAPSVGRSSQTLSLFRRPLFRRSSAGILPAYWSQTFSFFRRPRVWAVGVSFAILLSVSIALVWRARSGHESPHAVTETLETADGQRSSAAGNNAKQPDTSSPPGVPHVGSLPQPDKQTNRHLVARLLSIDLRQYSPVRDLTKPSQSAAMINLPRARLRLILRLPAEASAGLYSVSLTDAFLATIVSARTTTGRNRTLVVQIDASDVPATAAYLSVARKGEAPYYYPIQLKAEGN